jgi:hypothetical protein
MKRKHINWKTKCASALLCMIADRQGVDSWYNDAKIMTEDQFLSLFQWDHNILHETGSPDVDKYWNLAPMLILEHRIKTKTDAAIIAKGRRIRRKGHFMHVSAEIRQAVGNDTLLAEIMRNAYWAGIGKGSQEANDAWRKEANRSGGALSWRKPKLQSRGFDKTRRRKMDGTVVKRKG